MIFNESVNVIFGGNPPAGRQSLVKEARHRVELLNYRKGCNSSIMKFIDMGSMYHPYMHANIGFYVSDPRDHNNILYLIILT